MDTFSPAADITGATKSLQSAYLSKVCAWMMAALVMTALAAGAIQSLGGFQQVLGSHQFIWVGLVVVEIGMVIWLSARYQHMSGTKAAAIFMVYAALNGVTLSVIADVYGAATVAQAFFVAAGMFAGLGFWGWTTKKDLGKWGSALFVALLGLILCMIVSLFVHLTALEWAINVAGVLIFSGLTAYDFNRIRKEGSSLQGESTAVISALGLYLNFINMFLFLLRIFGGGR